MAAKEGTTALVLGVAFVNAAEAKKALVKTAKGTSSSLVRDRIRMLALQNQGWEVHTINLGQTPQQCEQNKHTQASFSRRGAKSVLLKHVDVILADYFRFPGA